jgi:hypothetical protein
LLLGACHGKDEAAQAGGSTPQAALQASLDLLRAGDFDRLWKQALPPADYANLRADWRLQQRDVQPGSARDRARLDQAMHELTGPDAEHRLYAELQPKLAAMEQQYRDQLPVLISVGEAVLKSGIAQSRTLSDAQKTQLDGMLDALLPWAQQAPWFDQARAKQAIGVAVATARQLDLKDPGQLHAMDFDASMARYAVAWGGLKQVLAIYGLSVDDAFDSVKLTPLSNDNGRAVVKIDYHLARQAAVDRDDAGAGERPLVQRGSAAQRAPVAPPAATAGGRRLRRQRRCARLNDAAVRMDGCK